MDTYSELAQTGNSPMGDNTLAGGGAMGELMRQQNWAASPLGEVSDWPQSLRTAVSICLSSRFPIILFWGPDLRQFYNDAYRPILGVSKHPQSLGQRACDCWPEIWDAIGPMLNGVLSTGEATWSENLYLPLERNGYAEECYFTFSYSPIRDEQGEVGGVFCAVTETTGEVLGKRRLHALQELAVATIQAGTPEEVCQRAAEILSEYIADIPIALLYLFSGRDHFATLAGNSGIEAGTLASPERIDLSDPDASWPLMSVIQTKQMELVEDLNLRFGRFSRPLMSAETELFPSIALVLPIVRPGDDRPYGFLIGGVSPRRPLDDDYRGFFTLIAGQIANAITTVRAYQDARERAEALAELDEVKTAFFSNVSHEFRTPLTLMLGPLETLLADTEHHLTTSQREQIELARRNGLRQLKLVNSLLDFSRIEAGRLKANSTMTDLARLTVDLASSFRSTIENAGIKFIVDCPPLPILVSIDRDMWEKIVFNLLSNAFKFTLKGLISISLRLLDDTILLEVADSGIGVSKDDLPHLFERFYRASSGSARSMEGTGIGLALVQELVRFYHGTISAASTEGQGTTITVRLPAADPLLSSIEDEKDSPRRISTALGPAAYIEEASRWLLEPERNPSLPAGEQDEISDLNGLSDRPQPATGSLNRVLVVDDNADMREYLHRLLVPYYQVQLASDGLNALALAQETLPDLIISDVMMPNMGGFGFLAALRAEPRTKLIPVIMLSARAGEEATLEGLAAGADDYLVKPFSTRELLARIRAQLEISRLQREATNRAKELETIFEAMKDGVVVSDIHGRITRANRAFNNLFGFKDTLDLLRTPDARANIIRPRRLDGTILPREEWPLDQALHGKPCYMDLLGSAQSGEDIILNASSAPLRDASGIIIGAMAVYRDVTEHQSLEKRLRAAEREASQQAQQRLAILEALTDSLIVYDAEGQIVYLNAATWAQIGTNAENGYDKRPLSLRFGALQPTDPSGEPLPFEAWPQSRILKGEVLTGVKAVEIVLHALDGQVRTVSLTGSPMYDAQGNIFGGVLISRDITESKLLEEALRRERQAFQMVAENAPDIISRFDREFRYMYVNPAIMRATGLSPAVFLGKTNQELDAPAALIEQWDRALFQVFTLAQPASVEYSLESPVGLRYYQANITPEMDEQGYVVSALAVSRDVTELLANQKRMQEAFNALLTVAEVLVTNYQVPEDSSNYEEANRNITKRILDAICRGLPSHGAAMVILAPETETIQTIVMTGFEEEVERLAYVRTHGKSLTESFDKLDNLVRLRQGEMVRIDLSRAAYQARRPDPAIKQALLIPMCLQQELVGMIVLYPAEPDRFYTLEELTLAESMGKLAAVLIERERLLSGREEAWASALAAREIAKQMDEFIGIISHELKTPITTIKGNLQLANRHLGRLNPPEKMPLKDQYELLRAIEGFVARAEQQVGVQNRLVNDLIDVSRVRADKLELFIEECDLAKIVQDVIGDQQSLTPNRNIQLDIPANEVLVYADAQRIGQVLNNYLSNALKYSASTRPVSVHLQAQDENGMVHVLVVDKGTGLSEEQQEHIWERFYRVPGIEVKSGSGVGLGLGLHICRMLIERQGGQVGIQSAPGEGSTFWFTLPSASL